MALRDLVDLQFVRARNVVPAVIALAFGVLSWFGIGPLLFGGGEDVEDAAPPVVAMPEPLATPEPVAVPEPPAVAGVAEPVLEPQLEEEAEVSLLVALADLEVGALIRREQLDWQEWRGRFSDASAVIEKGEVALSRVEGSVVVRRSPAGLPLQPDAFIPPGGRGFLPAVLAPGTRAVTVEADGATTSARVIFPGDRVDVILVAASVPGLAGAPPGPAAQRIVRDARVLAVGSDVVMGGTRVEERLLGLGFLGDGDDSSESQFALSAPSESLGNTFTLEVTPRDVERLSLATTAGSITLAMRSLRSGAGEPSWSVPVRMDEVVAPGLQRRSTLRVLRGAESESVVLSGENTVLGGQTGPTGAGALEGA